jgi:hypothetical protein
MSKTRRIRSTLISASRGARRDHPGIDDAAVERAKRAHRAFEHFDHIPLEGDVAMQGDGPAARALDFAHRLLRALLIAHVIDANRPAASAGEQGSGAADAA